MIARAARGATRFCRAGLCLEVLGAVLLASSTVLPLSSCDRSVDVPSKSSFASAADGARSPSPGRKTVTTYRYLFDGFGANPGFGSLALVGFVWPPFVLFALSRAKGRLARRLCRAAEVLLLAWSVVAVKLACLFATRFELGAYAAFTGVGAYAAGAAWSALAPPAGEGPTDREPPALPQVPAEESPRQ